MKTVYVCGDSFAVADPEYGASWPERLALLLKDRAEVRVLASIAASNTLINIQVNQAIADSADYIIMLATAVTRNEVAVGHSSKMKLLERFQQGELVAYSILRPYRSRLSPEQQQQVRAFHTEFFDLDLAIHRDHCIISATLELLVDSNCLFTFDQGGFEHPKFGGSQRYFAKYDQYRSSINLWDLSDTLAERPYYHIEDSAEHARIADYYYRKILNEFDK